MATHTDADSDRPTIMSQLSAYSKAVAPYTAVFIGVNLIGAFLAVFAGQMFGPSSAGDIFEIFFGATLIALFIVFLLHAFDLRSYVRIFFIDHWRNLITASIVFMMAFMFVGILMVFFAVDEDDVEVLAIWAAIISSLIYLLFAIKVNDKVKTLNSIEGELKRKIASANRSTLIALSVCAATGMVAIYFARGAIELTESSTPEIVTLLNELSARESAIRSLESGGIRVRVVDVMGDQAPAIVDNEALDLAKREIVEAINFPIDEIIEKLRLQREIASQSRLIEYRLFSGLFVRIGSIAIVMVVFAIAIGELKKSIKRAEETRQLVVSLKAIEASEFDSEKLLKARMAMMVSDTIDEIGEKSIERYATGETTGVLGRVYDAMFRKADAPQGN